MRGKAEATLVLEQAILDIVKERAPITVRGVCYALFVRKLIPSMEVNQTQRVSRIMTRCGRARRSTGRRSSTAAERSSAARHGATRTRSSRPPCAGIVATTGRISRPSSRCGARKSTVEGVLAPVLDELGVTFRVMKGFGSSPPSCRRPRTATILRGPEDRRPVHRRLGPVRALHERGRSAGAPRALRRASGS